MRHKEIRMSPNERLAIESLVANVRSVVERAEREAGNVPARVVLSNGIPDGPLNAARMLHAAYARGVGASFAATLWQVEELLRAK